MKKIINCVLLALGVISLTSCPSQKEPEIDEKEIKTSIQKLNDLVLLKTKIRKVVNHKDQNLFGKREVHFPIIYEIKTGINFNDINITKSNDKLTIQLPKAKIIGTPIPKIDSKQIYYDEGLFRKKINFDNIKNYTKLSNEDLIIEMNKLDIFNQAQKNAVSTISKLLVQAGIDKQKIEFNWI